MEKREVKDISQSRTIIKDISLPNIYPQKKDKIIREIPLNRDSPLNSSSYSLKRPPSSSMMRLISDDDQAMIINQIKGLKVAGSSQSFSRASSGIIRKNLDDQEMTINQIKVAGSSESFSRPSSAINRKKSGSFKTHSRPTSAYNSKNSLNSSSKVDLDPSKSKSKLFDSNLLSNPKYKLRKDTSISEQNSPIRASLNEEESKSSVVPYKEEEFANDGDFNRNLPFKRIYNPSPYQLYLAQGLMPEEERNEPSLDHSLYKLSQCYALQKAMVKQRLRTCLNKLVSEYPILSTSVYRNSKILDADIEFHCNDAPFEKIELGKYADADVIEYDQNMAPILQIWAEKEKWLSSITLDTPFKVILYNGPGIDTQQFMVIACSLLVLDELSLTFISKRLFDLYHESENLYNERNGVKMYKCEELESFEDYAYASVHSKKDFQFWKDQVVEVEQDQLGDLERKTIEGQMNQLEGEKKSLQNALLSATKQRQEFNELLMKLRKQRMELEKNLSGGGALSKFTDTVTGEITIVSEETKKALIRAVLGDEATGDNIIPLLEKHEVSKEVMRKINAEYMNIEQFSGLTEGVVVALNLTNRDKKQILALAEYVNNRIKECIQEQSKVKFSLEREIAKVSRGLEASNDNLSSMRNTFDSKEDLSFRLLTILHPPYEEIKVKMLSTNSLYDDIKKKNVFQAINKWGFIGFRIEDDVIDNLRKFRIDWTLNIKNKKKNARASSKQTGNFSSDNESLLESDDDDDGKRKLERKMKHKSVGSVCLAAFGVLMKHITGSEKFLVGVCSNFRHTGLILGPLSDVYPVKIDLSKKTGSFSNIFTSLFRIFKQIKRHGYSCPADSIKEKLGLPSDQLIEFQFISLDEFNDWVKLGYSMDDLLKPQEMREERFGSLNTEKMWSENKKESFDLRFIMVEQDDSIECGVRYRNDKFEAEKIGKWIAKFQSTLEGIDCNRRKISVSAMISRYYHPLWQANSSDIAETATNLTGSKSAMNLFSTNNLNGE